MNKINNKFKIILPIIIFAVVAILITIVLVFVNKDSNDEEKKLTQEEKTKEKDIYGIASLTEKYIVYDFGIEYCDDYTISKITGLKNKEIENKINKKIGNCKYTVTATIGNTMSLIEYDKDYNKVSYLNIRLDNGEEYKFEDIFLAEVSIEQIISRAANYYYSCKYSEEGCSLRFYDFDLGKYPKKPTDFDLDEEIYKIINIYRDEGVKNFNFESKTLNFQIGNIELFMPYESIWQDIAIYKRFLTKENIFITDSELTNYVFSFNCGDKYNGFILDNLFLDEYKIDDELPTKVLAAINKQNESINDKIKDIALKDKDHVYFMLSYPSAHESYTYDNVYINSSYFELFKINIKDYNSLGGEELIASEQRMPKADISFAFRSSLVKQVDIDNIIDLKNIVIDKNGNKAQNFCYISHEWIKIGDEVSVWNKELLINIDYIVGNNCELVEN